MLINPFDPDGELGWRGKVRQETVDVGAGLPATPDMVPNPVAPCDKLMLNVSPRMLAAPARPGKRRPTVNVAANGEIRCI